MCRESADSHMKLYYQLVERLGVDPSKFQSAEQMHQAALRETDIFQKLKDFFLKDLGQ